MKTGFGVTGGIFLALILIVGIVVGGAFARIWYINTFGTATQNAQTNVVRQTNQYITTQNTAALAHIQDYTQATTDGQKIYIVGQIWNDIASLTPDTYVPEVARFLATHPRGSK